MKPEASQLKNTAAAIHCLKCGMKNDADRDFCDNCNTTLYVSCEACGARNPRDVSRCKQCRQALHRPFWRLRYWWRRTFPRTARIKPAYFALFAVLVLLVYRVVLFLASFESAPPQ